MGAHRKPRIDGARGIAAAAAFLLLAGSAACSNPLGSDSQGFGIFVDSISAPEMVASNDTLIVRFFGRIGSSLLCSRLDRVDVGRGPNLLVLRFNGELNLDGDCPHMPAILDHVVRVPPPREYPFMIRVNQPDGSKLDKIVRVR